MKNRIPIAVVGMAGILPGALDLDMFWQNIINRVDSTCKVPDGRWIVKPGSIYNPVPMPDKAVSKYACLIDNFEFDPEGIDLDRDLLNEIDPLYQMVLHAGREVLSEVKPDSASLSLNRERIGTVLAAIALPTDASSLITRKILGRSFEERLFGDTLSSQIEPLTRKECLSGRVTSLPATILAKGLGLRGGSCTLDATCASSLYAVKLACDKLHFHRADVMLAGGVSRPESLYTQVGFSQLRALSPSGRCAPFDESADGLVVGEGIGILALKRLDDALRDGDSIYALIRGIGLSNDMGGNLLAPDSRGQVRAMRAAYESAGWSPHDIDLIECHGAGTQVGDATELNSLRSLWGESGWSYRQCAIGSVKSMVGHLLTAAGAAGMIKTLLALKQKTLPPSLNFSRAPEGSPLNSSPFRVQTDAEKWERRGADIPLRAAVSAFGFGGINGHILFEEWRPSKTKTEVGRQEQKSICSPQPPPPVAIVGMGTLFGSLTSLKDFQGAVFNGSLAIEKRPEARWKGCDSVADRYLDGRAAYGAYLRSGMNELSFDTFEFHIPPNEIPDILPQHLLMLKVSAMAMKDADLWRREDRPRMGVVVGIGFDFEATGFHLRWNLHNLVQAWKEGYGLDLDDDEMAIWLKSLRDSCGPPLTNTRTLGALGGIVASRIAREFRFGGPSFVVSNEEASGLKALETGVRSLQQNEADAVLVGAVDLAGDVRSIITTDAARPFTKDKEIYPFSRSGSGTLPGEGAVALVLKRLDRAKADGDRIYAVIKGMGDAGGGEVETASPSKEAYILSLKRSFYDAGIPPSSISFIEAHGSGDPREDRVEAEALCQFFTSLKGPCAIGCLKPNIGQTGAASGLASVAKVGLLLSQRIIPPLRNFAKPGQDVWPERAFYMPKDPQHWPENGKNSPRRACIAAMTIDGNCMHVILEEARQAITGKVPKRIEGRIDKRDTARPGKRVALIIGGKAPSPALPQSRVGSQGSGVRGQGSGVRGQRSGIRGQGSGIRGQGSGVGSQVSEGRGQSAECISSSVSYGAEYQASKIVYPELIRSMIKNTEAVSDAHKRFLNFSTGAAKAFAQTLKLQTELLQGTIAGREAQTPLFSREMCLEFARGSVANVLGPEFATVDTYRVRVRLPDEPLMLVDRIVSIEGKKGSLGPGRVVTEHDVLHSAWYLDGNSAPVCITVEAGQADLFLCSYLGIDFAVKGERTYRLLDATIKFHNRLPRPGDVIRYEIEIEKFVRQGDTYLFFFNFKGFITNSQQSTTGAAPLITMSNGCAGFFTDKEMESSGGIVLTEEESKPQQDRRASDWKTPVPVYTESYNDESLDRLRDGDLAGCFGALFDGIKIAKSLRLPGGRMKLIDRVVLLEPEGGRYRLGLIRAEADIHPDDWFLTCHFVDDMVMPGTLMYECCAHTLRVFIQRTGWVTEKEEEDVCYEPVAGVESRLKCRGPVTPKTRHVLYEVEIKKIGYAPEPYVIADAYMYIDDRLMVLFENISMKMSGITGDKIKSFWEKRESSALISGGGKKKAIFDYDRILAFATGRPSEAFGEPYRVFDEERFIARLPGPPYLFIDRIVSIEPEALVLEPGGWIEAEYDLPSSAWYFRADQTRSMPLCILLEIALQPCGWLAAYAGSAFRSSNDLKFRNLGGSAVLHDEVLPDSKALTMRARITQVSEAGEMIIEQFDMQILQAGRMIYEGNTTFGFFSDRALALQTGIYNAARRAYSPTASELKRSRSYLLEDKPPFLPDDHKTDSGSYHTLSLTMPARALRMIDSIEMYIPDGGPEGLGFIRGIKNVDPNEWFFSAHFYQDPVCPGSLGIESFIQLIKFVAIDRWKHLSDSHRFAPAVKKPHNWSYRGQILPKNRKIEVEAAVTRIEDDPTFTVWADGFLKIDGLYIYEMKNFGIRLIPKPSHHLTLSPSAFISR